MRQSEAQALHAIFPCCILAPSSGAFPKPFPTVSCPSTLHPRSLPTVSNPSTLHPCSLSPKICLKISHLSTLHPRFLPAKLLIYFQQFPVRASIFARSRAAFPLFPKVSGPSSLHPPCILVPPNGTFAKLFPTVSGHFQSVHAAFSSPPSGAFPSCFQRFLVRPRCMIALPQQSSPSYFARCPVCWRFGLAPLAAKQTKREPNASEMLWSKKKLRGRYVKRKKWTEKGMLMTTDCIDIQFDWAFGELSAPPSARRSLISAGCSVLRTELPTFLECSWGTCPWPSRVQSRKP